MYRAGRECKFSHITDESAQAALMTVSASTGEKTIAPGSLRAPCRFFKNNECSSGDKCPYLHQKASDRPAEPKKRTSTVKMHVLNPKPKAAAAASAGDDEDEEKAPPAAWTNGQHGSAEDPSEQHMSDFLTKEEGAAELTGLE